MKRFLNLITRPFRFLKSESSLLLVVLLVFCTAAFATPTTPTTDFIDNGDGTVTHNKTGLTWMRCAMGETWNQTNSTCTGWPTIYSYDTAKHLTTTFAGLSDWRLPSIVELQTIIERGNFNSAINWTIFPVITIGTYLSSSAYVDDPSRVWYVNFTDGHVFRELPSVGKVLLVRGSLSSPTPRFTNNGDGTITDRRTGLMWKYCLSAGELLSDGTCITPSTSPYPYLFSFRQAVDFTGTYAGYNDWRAPNANELSTLMKYDAGTLVVGINLFPDTFQWTISEYVPYSTAVWYYDYLNKDLTYVITRSGSHYYPVRLVRTASPPSIIYSFNMLKQSAINLEYIGKSYDANNAKVVELINTTPNAIKVNNVIVSDAGSFWVDLFVDNKPSCRPVNYTKTLKNFIIASGSSCLISIGFSPFDNMTAGKSISATVTLKTLINGVATDKTLNVSGIGRAQVVNAYNNKTTLWGQDTWAMAELKAGNPPINTKLVGAGINYGSAKFWYGGVIDSTLQKNTASIGDIVVFAQNSVNANGHVGVVIQTIPVLTMLSMNDIADANGVKVRKWSVRPIDWYPSKTTSWSPLITGFNATDATKHYGFVDWNSKLY